MENTVTPYFYKHQFRSAILQFMQLFAWIHVNQARPDESDQLVIVPVHYGLKDRVAAAILAGNTQNSVMRLPGIACYLSSMDLAPEHLKGFGINTTTKHLRHGGVFPDDIEIINSAQPTPLYLTFSVSIMSTNLDEKYQILEQILSLFSRNYQVQLQTSNEDIVSNKIIQVDMQNIVNESQYPPGAERRAIIHDLQFRALVYFSAPSIISHDIIRTIKIRMAALDSFDILDERGVDIEDYVFNDMELINVELSSDSDSD